ncbi:MAG: hypothetical protein NT091_03430, partial [Candidatus Falkowbacteria bacterium]|nr:hypothetical protein [Candidatus Falkowbacteria bacterium]
NNIKYSLIKYGEYKEIDYQNELKKARYIIWLGQSESQGIALEEALASNVPILVWEISCLGHWKASTTKEQNSIPQEWLSIKASVAPYFNSDCGYIINNEKEIDDGIDFMEKNLNMFNPRKYILDDLFLEKQAREFVGLFDKYWKSDSMSMNQKVINDQASWKNRFTWCLMLKIFYFLKI